MKPSQIVLDDIQPYVLDVKFRTIADNRTPYGVNRNGRWVKLMSPIAAKYDRNPEERCKEAGFCYFPKVRAGQAMTKEQLDSIRSL